jgi:ketosteroid isomerase-like protein
LVCEAGEPGSKEIAASHLDAQGKSVVGGRMDYSSARHIAVVRKLYSAFRMGDVRAILDVLTEDVEWGEPANPFNPTAGTRHGHTGFLEWLRLGKESEEILALEPRQFISDGGTVAVVGQTKCLAKSTGRTYQTDFVHLITFQGERISRFQEFFDTYAAGEAFRTDR